MDLDLEQLPDAQRERLALVKRMYGRQYEQVAVVAVRPYGLIVECTGARTVGLRSKRMLVAPDGQVQMDRALVSGFGI